VITQTVFKSKGAGDGFRRFWFKSDKGRIHIKPNVVHDLSAIQVFEGASNATAILIAEKSANAFSYPVPYIKWDGPSRIEQDTKLTDALASTTRAELNAIPLDPGKTSSPWLTAAPDALHGLRKIVSKSPYTAHAGCCTWLNGVFWIKILKTLSDSHILIENLYDVGKIEVEKVQAAVEKDLVYPLLRSRDISAWNARPSAYIILSQDPAIRVGIPVSEMKANQPKTYAYFKRFEEDLRGRSGYRRYFSPTDPFYSVYNVGKYTLSPIRVFWRQFIPELRMAYMDGRRDKFLGKKLAVTQHVVSVVTFDNEDAALFFAAFGNSSPARLLHWNSSTGKSYGTPSILDTIGIPRFSPSNRTHRTISTLSAEAHAAAAASKEDQLRDIEEQIDQAAAELWVISPKELKAIQRALSNISGGAEPDSDDEGDD
jgi:hypothetical protein